MKKYISTLLAAVFSASTFAALESPITESTTVSSSETVNSQLIVRSLDGNNVQLKISNPGGSADIDNIGIRNIFGREHVASN